MTRLIRRLRYLLRPAERHDRLAEELREHFALHIEELIEQGVSPAEAEARARRRFGNPTRVQEDSRAIWIARWVDDLVQDIRYALRSLRAQPGFAGVAIISSALGIGACATVFAVANYLLFRPLDVPEPDRIATLSLIERGSPGGTFSYPEFLDVRSRVRSLESASVLFPLITGSLGDGDNPRRVWGALVSADYFDTLGLKAAVGRTFDDSQDRPGTAPVMVISQRLWQEQFGGDPGVAGRQIRFNGAATTLLGVAPPGFSGTELGLSSDFWVPLGMAGQLPIFRGTADLPRNSRMFGGTVRIRAGVSLREAQSELDVLSAQMNTEHEQFQGDRFELTPAGKVNPAVRAPAAVASFALLAVTLLVLLIACANVANLLLARAATRAREIATRLAIGAGRGRLVRQLLTESLALALVGGAFGVLLASWATALLSSIRLPLPLPLNIAITLDQHVVWFAAGLSVLTALGFGLVPALKATNRDLTSSLKDNAALSGRRTLGLTSGLVMAQVAVSAFLSIGAGLFFRSLASAAAVDLGMRAGNLLFLGVDPIANGYSDERARAFFREAAERIGALPAVRSVSYTDVVPLSIAGGNGFFVPEERRDDPRIRTAMLMVGPRYFETFGIRMVEGDEFDHSRSAGERPIIVNQEFARRAFRDGRVIGRRLDGNGGVYRIVGVAATSKIRTIGEAPTPAAFLPAAQLFGSGATLGGMTVAIRTAGPPAGLANAAREEIRALDPALAIYDVKTIDTHLSEALLLPRLAATFFGLCGATGLAIAAIGLYGVMSFTVARRTKEIGIRVALGAQPGQVVGAVLRGGFWMAAAGAMIGMGLAFAAMRLAASLFYGISSSDPATYIGVVALLAAVSLIAAWVPARRAARLDPLTTLRQD